MDEGEEKEKKGELEEGERKEGELEEGELEEGELEEGELEEGELEEGELEEGELEEGDLEEPEKVEPTNFPLAKFFRERTSSPAMKIRLAFLRREGGKGALKWSWPTTVALLAGWSKYSPLTKIPETKRLEALPLDEWIKAYGNTGKFFPANLRSAGLGGVWNIVPSIK